MQAKDVMTHPVISVSTQGSILEAVRLMLQHKVSGLPVFDELGNLAGIVTEGDFLRRVETDTLRRRPRWIELIVGPGKLAEEYVRASTCNVSEVMTTEVHAVSEDAPLGEIVTIMEQNRIRADACTDLEHVAHDEGHDVARKIRLPIRRGGEQLELVADVLARFRH